MHQQSLRMVLLLNWREKGYARPQYGLVDDEVLLRKGEAPFLASDGQRWIVRRGELVMLDVINAQSRPPAKA